MREICSFGQKERFSVVTGETPGLRENTGRVFAWASTLPGDGKAIQISTESRAMRTSCFGIIAASYICLMRGGRPTDAVSPQVMPHRIKKRPFLELQAAITF